MSPEDQARLDGHVAMRRLVRQVRTELAAAKDAVNATMPLHVRVARALGCEAEPWAGRMLMHWRCTCEDGGHSGPDGADVAEYDKDWSRTGPLIQACGYQIGTDAGVWWAADGEEYIVSAFGATPLVAVCNLVLALHVEAGHR